MYKLTLTPDERAALDFVGYRYLHGDELYRLLWVESSWAALHPQTGAVLAGVDLDGNEIQWDSKVDLEFRVEEHIAWQIQQIRDDDAGDWTCFAPRLKEKLNEFCDKIV